MDQTGNGLMKATPIAEFLARKGADGLSQRPTPPANPFAARRASAVNDDPEPEFRRSGLVAALARRSPEGPPLVRPLDGNFAPRREPPPRQPPPLPPPPEPAPDFDLEERLSEAYHRGVQEGLDAAKSERALERAEQQKRAVVDKLDFQMNEFARLSETLKDGFADLEKRLAQATARLLRPLLEQAVARQI